MKIISWNINGIKAVIRKGLFEYMEKEEADIYCEGYHRYWNQAEKNGYSGTMVLSKDGALSETQGIGDPEFDTEGRVITLEYENFYLVNVYVVNAQRGLLRIDYKMKWNAQLQKHVQKLKEIKPVLICGDFNVSHKEIDLKNPKTNKKNAGFSIQERNSFTELLNAGFTDIFRTFNKETDQYTWWSYRNNARARNIGWRLDYFLVSNGFEKNIEICDILPEVKGSDHCPVRVILND